MRLIYLLLYEIKYAFRQMRTHYMLCLSAISCIFVSVFLISLFLISGLSIDALSHDIESDVRIHVVLKDEIRQTDQIEKVQKEIESIKNVDTVTFSDADNELEIMIAEKGKAFEIYRGEENPLSNAFFVTVKDGMTIDETSNKIKEIEGVSACAYGGSSVMKLMNILNTIRYVGYGAVALLLMLSVYLIYNTISSTIASQEDEISIMTTVGASRSFVRIPFQIQGICIGFLGSLLAFLLIRFGYEEVYSLMNGKIMINMLKLVEPAKMIHTIRWIILLIGTLLGWSASFMAVSRRVKRSR